MRAVQPPTLTRLSRRLGLAACGLWVAVCGVACVEEDEAEAFDGALRPWEVSRTRLEEQRAEEVEALLPGAWIQARAVPEEAELDLPALSISFLGHEAVTGDAALLLEVGDDAEQTERRIQAARVQFSHMDATLHLGDRAWRMDLVEEDLLVLQDLRSGAKWFFARSP